MTGEFAVQGLSAAELAEEFGTPMFVYDGEAITTRFVGLREKFHPAMEIFYSLKANPAAAICGLLHSLGARAEVSSLVELMTARLAGVPASEIIFLGPGKSEAELAACLDQGILAIVAESVGELALIDQLARARGCVAPVALRVNPSFDVKGTGLTMGGRPRQFGIDEELLWADPGLATRFGSVRLMGVHVYLGTRILSADAIVANTGRVLDLAERLAATLGFPLELVDVGGGYGVAYFEGETDLDEAAVIAGVNPLVASFAARHPRTRIATELGRYLTAPAGTYVVRVRYTKTSKGERFAITDGGTHQHMAAIGLGSFARRNFPVRALAGAALTGEAEGPAERWQVTGPLCTPNDVLAKDVLLPPLRPGDLLGVLRSGAYGPTASPVLFLGHGYPAEVLVLDGRAHLIRERDDPARLLERQHCPVFH